MRSRLSAWLLARPDLPAALGIALLPFALLGRALLPGRVLSPADILLVFPPWAAVAPGTRMANGLLTDVTFMIHPWFIHAGREIAAGRFPLWNPHAFGGAPFFANPQTALLFPLTWLAVILPASLAVTLIAILKLSLAGVGMYGFLRLLALRPLAAAAGALAFMLDAALVMWLQWPVGTGIAALPFLFGATEWLVARPGPGRIAALALTVALAIFGGYLQTTAVAVVAAGAWALVRARSAPRPLAAVTGWAVGAGLGVALAAVQILPFLEYTRLSSVYFYRSQWMPAMAAPAHTLVAQLMPYYFGSPTGRDFWGYWNFNEIAGSVGLVPWLALPAALVGAWRRPATRFFVVLGVLAAVAAYDVPGLTRSLDALPLVSLVIAFRFVAFLAFALSVLGAIGVEALASAGPELRRRLRRAVRVGFVALVAVTLGFVVADRASLAQAVLRVPVDVQFVWFLGLLTAGALGLLALGPGGRFAAAGAAAIVAVSVVAPAPLAATYNPVTDARTFYPTTPAIEHVRRAARAEPTRVMFGIGKNMGMVYGLDEMTGYDGMTPRHVEEVVGPVTASGFNLIASGSLSVTSNWVAPVFDLLGISRIIVPLEPQRLPGHWQVEYTGPDARVFLNPRVLPRAFLAPRGRPCVDDASALRLMHGGEVDFRQEALLADCRGVPPAAASPRPPGRVALVGHEASRVVLRAESEGGGFVVLTDTWFPGWLARVDGVEAPVLRADHAFRAVWVEAGRHEVELRYEPESVQWGLALSLAASLGLLGLLGLVVARHVGGRGGPGSGPGLRAAMGLALALGLAGALGPAEATTLPPSPVRLDVSEVRVGEEATIQLRATGSPTELGVPVDLYIARLPTGPPYPAYLTPHRAWTRVITPFARHAAVTGAAPIAAGWREDGPFGWITLLVILCHEGASPTDRTSWVFQPVVARVRVYPSRSMPGAGAAGLALLGLAALGAVALVTVLPRPPRPPSTAAESGAGSSTPDAPPC